eukprot:Rmarinus@m.12849
MGRRRQSLSFGAGPTKQSRDVESVQFQLDSMNLQIDRNRKKNELVQEELKRKISLIQRLCQEGDAEIRRSQAQSNAIEERNVALRTKIDTENQRFQKESDKFQATHSRLMNQVHGLTVEVKMLTNELNRMKINDKRDSDCQQHSRDAACNTSPNAKRTLFPEPWSTPKRTQPTDEIPHAVVEVSPLSVTESPHGVLDLTLTPSPPTSKEGLGNPYPTHASPSSPSHPVAPPKKPSWDNRMPSIISCAAVVPLPPMSRPEKSAPPPRPRAVSTLPAYHATQTVERHGPRSTASPTRNASPDCKKTNAPHPSIDQRCLQSKHDSTTKPLSSFSNVVQPKSIIGQPKTKTKPQAKPSRPSPVVRHLSDPRRNVVKETQRRGLRDISNTVNGAPNKGACSRETKSEVCKPLRDAGESAERRPSRSAAVKAAAFLREPPIHTKIRRNPDWEQDENYVSQPTLQSHPACAPRI